MGTIGGRAIIQHNLRGSVATGRRDVLKTSGFRQLYTLQKLFAMRQLRQCFAVGNNASFALPTIRQHGLDKFWSSKRLNTSTNQYLDRCNRRVAKPAADVKVALSNCRSGSSRTQLGSQAPTIAQQVFRVSRQWKIRVDRGRVSPTACNAGASSDDLSRGRARCHLRGDLNISVLFRCRSS